MKAAEALKEAHKLTPKPKSKTTTVIENLLAETSDRLKATAPATSPPASTAEPEQALDAAGQTLAASA